LNVNATTAKDAIGMSRTKETKYVLKFGGPMETPIRAARIAHMLGVPTPRIVNVDQRTCAELWDSHATLQVSGQHQPFADILGRWKKNDGTLSIQEWAHDVQSPEENYLPGAAAEQFWYTAGTIAGMDWIVGKADLFNDIPLNLVDSATAIMEAESNMGNIKIRLT